MLKLKKGESYVKEAEEQIGSSSFFLSHLALLLKSIYLVAIEVKRADPCNLRNEALLLQDDFYSKSCPLGILFLGTDVTSSATLHQPFSILFI